MKKILLLFLMSSFAFSGFAQTFQAEIGPAFALGDYAKDDINDEDEFGAGIGLNLGLTFSFPITDFGLDAFAETGLIFNPQQKGFRDDIEDYYDALVQSDVDYTHIKYLGFPLMGGLQFASAPEKAGVGFFVKAGAGVGFFKPLAFQLEADSYDYNQTFDMSTGFAFTIGGGVIINDLTIGLKYLGLGNREFDGEQELDYKDGAKTDEKSKIKDLEVAPSIFAINVGFRF